ncbi:Trp biosynthesis-associated membrane protein [Geodermatophilus sp. CPCC 206100]|uniref:Trp biosynthesis-associated membrane protein n=1 Tax=Geodermatophilus sp. CPCC 206100 TaxID=3020054 RepID=UPI003B0056EC
MGTVSGQRRELAAAVAGTALAGALALSAGGQTWVTATVARPEPLPPTTAELGGSSLAPLVSAAGLLLLAAAVALLAVRGAGRWAVGLLVSVAGGVLAWSGLRPLVTDVDGSVVAALGPGTRAAGLTTELSPGWPLLALVAGVVAVLAGLLTVLRGRGWPGMGRRYERAPADGAGDAAAAPARPRSDEDRALDAWRALDRGEDPTESATETR